jgi:hypothetical protein
MDKFWTIVDFNILENRKGGSKRQKELNLTTMKTTSEGSKGH